MFEITSHFFREIKLYIYIYVQIQWFCYKYSYGDSWDGAKSWVPVQNQLVRTLPHSKEHRKKHWKHFWCIWKHWVDRCSWCFWSIEKTIWDTNVFRNIQLLVSPCLFLRCSRFWAYFNNFSCVSINLPFLRVHSDFKQFSFQSLERKVNQTKPVKHDLRRIALKVLNTKQGSFTATSHADIAV